MNNIKKLLIYPLALVVFFGLSANECLDSNLDELLEIDGPIEFERTNNVDIQEGDPTEFTEIAEFETTYKGIDVTDLRIDEMVITIENYEAPETVLMSVNLYIEGYEDDPIRIDDYNIEFNNGQSIDVATLAEAKLSEYETYLLELDEAKIFIETSVDRAPVKFDFTFQMALTVTGTPAE